MARKLFAYARGEDAYRTRPTALQAAYQSFADGGFRLRALLTALAEGPELYRAPPPAPDGKLAMH